MSISKYLSHTLKTLPWQQNGFSLEAHTECLIILNKFVSIVASASEIYNKMKEGNVLFNNALNISTVIWGQAYMVKDHSVLKETH